MTNKWLKVALMAAAIATGTSIKIDAETVLYRVLVITKEAP